MRGEFDGLGRFADPSLLILTSLADGPKHGYAIMTDVAAFSGVSMEPGALFGALSRLERQVVRVARAGRARPQRLKALNHIQCKLVRGTDELEEGTCTESSTTSAGSLTRRC